MKLDENNHLNLRMRTKEIGKTVTFSLTVNIRKVLIRKQNLVTNILNSK